MTQRCRRGGQATPRAALAAVAASGSPSLRFPQLHTFVRPPLFEQAIANLRRRLIRSHRLSREAALLASKPRPAAHRRARNRVASVRVGRIRSSSTTRARDRGSVHRGLATVPELLTTLCTCKRQCTCFEFANMGVRHCAHVTPTESTKGHHHTAARGCPLSHPRQGHWSSEALARVHVKQHTPHALPAARRASASAFFLSARSRRPRCSTESGSMDSSSS